MEQPPQETKKSRTVSTGRAYFPMILKLFRAKVNKKIQVFHVEHPNHASGFLLALLASLG
jgi:hypothetical protein